MGRMKYCCDAQIEFSADSQASVAQNDWSEVQKPTPDREDSTNGRPCLRDEIRCRATMSQQSERSAAGLKWFRATYPKLTDGKVRVSRYYPHGKSTWKPEQPTWAFEFPLKDLESAVSVTYCVCQSKDGGSFYCLRVPHQHVLDHRTALYERIDKSGGSSISVFLAADPAARFRDVRSAGGIDFGQFLLPVGATS
jgi:hypothetical protein